MLKRLFFDHPRAVGESYGQHLLAASSFGLSLVLAGIACVVHALVPALFATTASDAVDRLHERMVIKRRARLRER